MQKDTWVPNTRKTRVKNKIQPAQTTCEPTVFSQLDSEDDFHTAPSSPEPGALYEFEEEEKDIQTNQGQFPSTLTFLNSLQEQCLEFERRFESNEERETQLDMKMKNFYEVQESLKLQLLELKVRCSINRNSKPPTTDVDRMRSTPKQPVNQKRDAAVEQPNTTAVADITTNTVTRTRKSTTTASLISKASDQQRKTKGKRGAELQYADYMPLKMDAVMEPDDWVTQTNLLRRIEQSNKRRLSINNETDQLKISVPHSLPLQKKKAKISEDVEPYPNNRLVRAVIDKPISKNLFSKSSNSSSSGDENIDGNKSPKDEKISEEAVELIQPAQLITLRNQQVKSYIHFIKSKILMFLFLILHRKLLYPLSSHTPHH